MTTVNIYLNFNGNCEEAFNFYKSVFGGEFPYIGKFKDMPPQEGMPPMVKSAKLALRHHLIVFGITPQNCRFGK